MGALLTAQDVAARWSCDDSVVHKLAARRLLRGLKFGRMWRFRLEDVEAYEAARVVEPAAPERQRTARTTATANAPAADLGRRVPAGRQRASPVEKLGGRGSLTSCTARRLRDHEKARLSSYLRRAIGTPTRRTT